MRRICLLASLLTVITVGAARSDDSPTATLTVKVTGLRSEKGKVKVALHASEDTFPTKRKLVYAGLTVPVNGHQATAIFPELPPGDYAVAAFHDEDNDGRLDRNVIGIPTEGTAASRNPKPRMGPPRWKDCVITIPTGETSIKIRVR